ncbi:MFS transporter [Microbacterium sp. NPDC091313]
MLETLRRRGVIALLATSMLARLPVAMSTVALVRLVVDSGGDFGYAAVLTAAFALTSTVGQPLLGRLIDVAGRRRLVLLLTGLVSAAALAVVAVTAIATPELAVVAVAVAGLTTAPVEPILRSLWPTLFTAGRPLTAAYSVDAAAQEVMFIGGPLVAAGGLALLGPVANVVAMAVVGLVGVVGFATRAAVTAAPTPERREQHGTPLASPAFRLLLVTVVTAALPVGVLAITANAYAEYRGDSALGALAISLNAAGALAGALLIARFPPTRAPRMLLRVVAVLLAVLYLPLAAADLPPLLWIAGAVVAGVSLPPFLTQVFSLTPELIDPAHATEANAWVVSTFGIGIAAGTLLAGIAVDILGIPTGILVAVVGAAALGLAGAACAVPRRLVSPAPVEAG